MGLKLNIKALDEVPENARGLYVENEDGEGYKLEVDDAVPKTKLDEFRNNNKKLQKEREDLAKRYEGIDPDEVKTLKDRLAEMERGEGKKKDETKAELEHKIQILTQKHQKDLEAKDAELANTNSSLAKALIDSSLSSIATEMNVRPEALTDVLLRGKNVFKLEAGKVVAFDGHGDKWLSESTGDSLTIKEWFKELTKLAPHLFKDSNGSGAQGGGKSNGAPTANPWKSGNKTEQALLMKADIGRARRLATEAGAKVTF